jgi:hypothetical protein
VLADQIIWVFVFCCRKRLALPFTCWQTCYSSSFCNSHSTLYDSASLNNNGNRRITYVSRYRHYLTTGREFSFQWDILIVDLLMYQLRCSACSLAILASVHLLRKPKAGPVTAIVFHWALVMQVLNFRVRPMSIEIPNNYGKNSDPIRPVLRHFLKFPRAARLPPAPVWSNLGKLWSTGYLTGVKLNTHLLSNTKAMNTLDGTRNL